MKCIVLHGRSAAEAWDIGLLHVNRLVDSLDWGTCASNAEELNMLVEATEQFTRPVHIAVPDRQFRRDTSFWKAHALLRNLPQNSFYQIDEGVYAEAPHLFFALAAGRLPFIHACLLGMELCGRYSTNPIHVKAHRTVSGKDYLERPAPTSALLLQRYATALGLERKSTVQRACKVIANGSRSPRESILHLMMRLPRRNGGYLFSGFRLNHRIPLPPELAALMNEDTLQVDFYWKDHQLAVEYDGADFHSGEKQRSYDNIRRSVLRQLGIQVITIDKHQMANLAVLDGIMQIVSESIGGPQVLQDAKSRQKRAALHDQLLASNICLYR